MLSGLILDALFPDACLACLAPREAGSRHDLACDACLRSVALPEGFTCLSCGKRGMRLVPECHPHAASRIALAPAESRIVGELASALLYDGMDRAAQPLAELLAAAAASLSLHRTTAVPIPTLPAELRERGYDANRALAQEFARLLDLELAPHLLTAVRRGGLPTYGIGTSGDAASALLLTLVSVTTLSAQVATHCAQLARAACPHASVVFLACTT